MEKGDVEELQSESPSNPLLPMRIKYLTTAAIFFGNISFGCAYNAFAPALVDLKNKYETDISTISIVFTILTGSALVGALTSAFIYEFLNRQLGIIFLLFGMSLAMYVTPHCPSIATFFLIGALLGLCGGAYDASQMVWMIEMWQNEAGPFIQAQHFCYALGSLMPSLLLAPFLTEEWPTSTSSSTDSVTTKHSDMYIPFTIAGGLSTVAGIYVALLFIFKRYHAPPPEENRIDPVATTEHNDDGQPAALATAKWLKYYRIKLILLAASFLGAYVGMELCTMQFIPTFAQYSLGLSEKQGARILTWLSGAYATGRAAGILIILKVPAHIILCLNILLVMASNVLLLLFGNNSLTMLRISSVLLGLGFSTIYASFCAFIERHLIFTNMVGALMMVSGTLVSAIYPLIIGRFIEENPVVMTYTSFFSVTICAIAFGILYKITSGNVRNRNESVVQ